MKTPDFEGKSHYDGQNPGHVPTQEELIQRRRNFSATQPLPPVDPLSSRRWIIGADTPQGDLRIPRGTEEKHRHFGRRSDEGFYEDDAPIAVPQTEIKG